MKQARELVTQENKLHYKHILLYLNMIITDNKLGYY